MAPRTRMHVIRYGGEYGGVSNYGTHNVDAYMGTHSCTDETHPGPPFRTGGPLLINKKKFNIDRTGHLYSFYHSSLGWYNGKMWVKPYLPASEPSPTDLSGWGAKGWARTFPVHPIYNLGVSIVELKDFPHMIRQTVEGFRQLTKSVKGLTSGFKSVRDLLRSASNVPRQAGSSYLYAQFGVVPMLQDLLFLLKMQEKLRRKIAWLRKHNDKPVRRKIELDKGEFSEDISRSIAPVSSMSPPLSTYLYNFGMTSNVSMPILKTYQRRIWYVAKYRYHIPELVNSDFPKAPSKSLVADLLGLTPDPGVLWKATPWSWLLDWFTSVGDVLSTVYLRAKYQVVAQYAYVMCEEHLTYTVSGYVSVVNGVYTGEHDGAYRTMSGTSKTYYEFKQREWANPYGFGFTFASLSAYQLSILVALGLSRGAKSHAPRA